MIKKFILSFFIYIYIFSGINYSKELPSDLFSKFNNIKGKYFGQTPPGVIPKLFAPFLLDYKKNHMHSALAFSPEGDEIYFSVYVNDLDPQKMFFTKMTEDGTWSKPELAPFSGIYHEGHPLFSPDGKRLYFYSKRPFKKGEKIRNKFHIWYVEKKRGTWGKPEFLVLPMGNKMLNYPSHFSKDGSFNFKVNIEKEGFKLFKGHIIGKKIVSVKKMEKPVTVDPLDEYLIYNVVDTKLRRVNFKIGFKKKDGSWTKSRLMGDTINSNQTQSRFPGFSPDGKYFFFSSYRSGYEKIYWVSRDFFEVCRKNDLNLASRLYKVFENEGIEALRKQLIGMKNNLSNYYPFSKQLLNEVAYRFLAKGRKDDVQNILILNFSLYPEENFFIEKLLLSLLKSNNKLFEESKKNIKKLSNEYLLDEINVLAFNIMNGNLLKEAVKVYQFNTELFPKSSKVFDRLGRAYLRANKKKEAIKAYKKAISLDKNNQTAIEALKII